MLLTAPHLAPASPARRLACLGGAPAFAEPLHVGRPNFGNRARFLERMEGIFDRRWLSNSGPLVEEFERRLSAVLGVRHCMVCCNATVALEITARALGLAGEVIVPAFTFVATAHALRWQGIRPVFADIDPATHNIDPASVERLITPRTTGIVGVHLWGRGCDVEALEAIAQKHRLRLMFDAAHALACTHGGQTIGSFGAAEVFSFHATKFLSAGEGGAIATNDDELAAKIRLMRNFGFAGMDKVIYLGTNGKMDELSAAMGLTNLESLDEFIEVNRRNYAVYRQVLEGCAGLRLAEHSEGERTNHQYVIAEVDAEAAGLTRDELVAVLHQENVLVRRYFHPGCHRMMPYSEETPPESWDLPVTERLCQRVLAFPTGTAVGPGEIEKIGDLLQTALSAPERVRAALAGQKS